MNKRSALRTPHSETIRVLLIEDNPGDVQLIGKMLDDVKGETFDLECADRLSAGLKCLAEGGVDVLLLDLGLPDSQGLETFVKVCAQAQGLPIVVLTELDDEGLAVQAVQEGAQDYLVKGQVESNLLGRAIRYAIERKRLEAQLIWSQKMETVGRLAGSVAHDFNNILTTICGYAELGMMKLDPSDRVHRDLEEILRASDRAANLTRQLLAFSRRQITEPRVINLNDVLLDMDKMLRRLIGEDIELVTLPAEDLGRVRLDASEIEQVIVNLIINARDAMPEGGKLTLETADVTLDKKYARQHVGVTPGDYVMLAASDTGVGMTEDVKAHVFESFFTTKELGKGTGLGLATCHGIVKQSGGSIWVYSEPGKGTTFKIYLPRVGEEAEAPPERDESGYLPRGTEAVLLVEDEPSVRNITARMLRDQGYTVFEAANGEEALRVAEERGGEEINLLLTDVVMPQIGGKELADRLKAERPDIRVLFFSGYADEAIVHHGVLDPGVAFVQKPYSAGMLARNVREVLDR